MVTLFEYVKANYNTYPNILGYHYMRNVPADLDNYDYVFIASDYSDPLPTTACQMMMSAEEPGTYMWVNDDLSNICPLPESEYTDVPTVGFVGRIPIFRMPGVSPQLHRGFQPRYDAYMRLIQAENICFDAHVRFEPSGDSAGFWNASHPDFKKHQPLFKMNMLANQYQLCARGNANWSLRFFETLAYGRIPVYIESGGRLPWDHVVDYFDGTFVYVRDIQRIEEDILTFHETVDMKTASQNCRKLYDNYFSQEAQIRMFDEFPPGN